MTVLRGLTILGICLFLALTSVTLAVARGAPQPVGVMVLCTGEGARQVPIDARGQPVAPPHVCPDCLLAFHGLASRDPLPTRHAELRPARHGTALTRHAAAPQIPERLARAPPRRV
jgi:hypothetical protein